MSLPHHLNHWDGRWGDVPLLFSVTSKTVSFLLPETSSLISWQEQIPAATPLYRSLFPTSGHFLSSVKILVLAQCLSLQTFLVVKCGNFSSHVDFKNTSLSVRFLFSKDLVFYLSLPWNNFTIMWYMCPRNI